MKPVPYKDICNLLSVLFFFIPFTTYSQYPTDLITDVEWNAGTSTLADIEQAFNNGRTQENTQLGIQLPMINLPTQQEWDVMSDDARALWLLNEERLAREVIQFSHAAEEVSSIASNYANYLGENDVFGHSEDGKTPWERLNADPMIAACNDGSAGAENLYVSVSNSGFPTLSIERAIYGWIYDDSGSGWGHRHACLRSDFNDNGGQQNEEGLIGMGKTEVRDYKGPFSSRWEYATIIVFNFIDPCANWDYESLSIMDFADSKFEYIVFPNPASGRFLNIASASEITGDYTITNLLGGIVTKGKLSSDKIDIDSLNSGIYTITITERGKSVVRKFVKQ